MAYAIGFHCTACGVCASTCPNGAIRKGLRRPWIEPLLCTECLLYAPRPQCADACPAHAIFQIELKRMEGRKS